MEAVKSSGNACLSFAFPDLEIVLKRELDWTKEDGSAA